MADNEKKILVSKAALVTILKLAAPGAQIDEAIAGSVFDLLADSPNYAEKLRKPRKSRAAA